MKAIMRQAKNTVMQFSEIECKVREATSNDSWGASTSQMAEIAKATNDYQEYPQLFAMLWKRLNDVEHIMHVQKALILVEYLLRNGADRFINDAKRRARDIAALKKYKHYDANNQDDAKEARAKAKVVYDMLMDDAKLQEERAKALKIKDVRLTGFGSDGGVEHGSRASQDYGNGTGTSAAPPTRHQRADSDQADPFDSSNEAAPAPARKSTAKDKAAAASTPDTQHTEPVKKKKKKKVVAAETEAAESAASESATSSAAAPKLDTPAGDVKKKKKKKKAVTEDAKESEHGDGFDDPFSNGQTNGKVSAFAAYSAASSSNGTGTGRSFVDEFSGPAPVTYQQTHQEVDLLTGRAPLRVVGSGDLVDLFSAPNPASPMNQQKLQEIAQQPFDPLGRDANHVSSSGSGSGSDSSSSSAPADLWQATDLMNLNDITKSNNKPNKKLAQTGPTMAQLRAQNPSTSEVPLSTLGFSASPAPAAAAPVPFAAPPYASTAPMGYPPVQQMGALSLGYPPQAAGGYPGMAAPGYPGYVAAPPAGQPLLALMPPSAFQSGAGPVSAASPHADLPFAVQPGSRPQAAYNSNKPVIFDVVSAQKVAQAQADPHYNYNTSQRVVSARNNNNNSLAANW